MRGQSSEATAVYGVSVDSRSRPAGQPDNKYDIDLGRTLDRVKSIQLGSIQIPDCRYTFNSTSLIQYSEPFSIDPNCCLIIEQQTQILNKMSGSNTTQTHQIQILIPPTLNKITGYNGLNDVVTTQYDTGLKFGIQYYPLIGQKMKVSGAHFPQSLMTSPMPGGFPSESGPVLTSSTVTGSPSYTNPSTGTGNMFQYAAGYINALLSGDTTNHDSRHVIPGVAWSYISAPKPTLVELFTMLNAALNDLMSAPSLNGTITAASNATPIIITTLNVHGLSSGDQVTISDVTGNTATNGTFIITVTGLQTFSLNGSSGNGAYINGGTYVSVQGLDVHVQFGFDDVTNKIVASAPTRVFDTHAQKRTISARILSPSGSLGERLGFSTSRLDPPSTAYVSSSILRVVNIRKGTYSVDSLIDMMNIRMNPLVFLEEDATVRTLRYTIPTGTLVDVIIPRGRYTTQQFVDFLNFYMSTAPSQITVTYNTDTGKFTFTHNLGLVFGLIFSGAENIRMASKLGFEAVTYDGSSTYTSVNRALFGVSSDGVFPVNTYYLSADTTQKHFTFDSGDNLQFIVDQGTNTANISAVWKPLFACSTSQDGFSSNYTTGDILFARRPFRFGKISDASNATPIVITTVGPHGLDDGDSVTISCVQGNTASNGTWKILKINAIKFSLDGSSGNGVYIITGDDYYSSNSVDDGGGNQVSTNTYTVIVQSIWDASGGLGNPRGNTPATITLEPTVSIFSMLDSTTINQALGVPVVDTNRILLQSANRNVFQLFFAHPDSCSSNFGFPPIAWPPSIKALQMFDSSAVPTYNTFTQCVPISSSYTSPFCWNLSPPDYIIMVLKEPCGSRDLHTHSFRNDTRSIFAKLYITAPYLQISEQMLFSTFSQYQRINKISVEFQNPDGTLVEFNGRSHTFSLLFTLYEATAEALCF